MTVGLQLQRGGDGGKWGLGVHGEDRGEVNVCRCGSQGSLVNVGYKPKK